MRNVIVELAASAVKTRKSRSGDQIALTMSDSELDLPGFSMDVEFGAVPLDKDAFQPAEQVQNARGASVIDSSPPETVIVRGTVDADTEEDLEKAKAKIARKKDVVHVWDDGLIEMFGCKCGCGNGAQPQAEGADLPGIDEILGDAPQMDDGGSFHTSLGGGVQMAGSPCEPTDCAPNVAKGTIGDVARYLGCHRLWDTGVRGQGVAIGIVDTGVDKTKVPNVTDGWTPNPAQPWGTDSGSHGSMCATDAKGMAPDAEIYDIGLLKSQGGMAAFLSDAIVAFEWAINKYKTTGKPQILSNSWGMYQRAWAPDYVDDPNHPFTRKMVEAVDAGMIVTFAAGNCGQVCPSGRCGSDSGPGKSIWGANGHPRAITVGAANIREEWIGYSSQGPAALDPRKPDFVAPSHFKGFTASDNGTSAANPVCAGVCALLRGHDDGLRQDAVKKALQETAKDLCGRGWDPHSGHGMIHAERAFRKLNYFATPLIHANWIHGHAARVERPEQLAEERLFGFYSMFRGKPGTSNWFHFALPTPVIVHGRRLALDSVMVMFWTDPSVRVHALHVWDANYSLKRYDGLNLSGSHWFERFDVLNNRVRFGVGVSVGVTFGEGTDKGRILFGSCGGDFVA